MVAEKRTSSRGASRRVTDDDASMADVWNSNGSSGTQTMASKLRKVESERTKTKSSRGSAKQVGFVPEPRGPSKSQGLKATSSSSTGTSSSGGGASVELSEAEKRTMNKPDGEGEIALHKVVYEYFALASGVKSAATAKRMVQCVGKARALCVAGAKVNHKNKYGDTPLLAAAQTDSAEIGKVLLEFGADLSLKNRQGYTPLLMAASENRPAALAIIVPEMAAQRRSLDALSGGYAAQHWACINNAPKMLAVLLKYKANKNCATEPDRHTPLIKAAAYNSAACVELLLRARADANARDADGRTALHHAAKNKATLCVQMLIASGVPVDALDNHNQKAVFYAAIARSKACVTAISAATPNFKATPDAAKVKLLLDGKRIAADDDDDDVAQSSWGGCFGTAGPGCF